MSIEILFAFFLIAILAGWIDTIAGGGGILTVPALLISGMDPSVALATNKLQGSVGTATSSYYFINKKVVNLNEMWGKILLTFLGSIVGSWLLLLIDSKKLLFILPLLLITISIYTLLSPEINDQEKKSRIKKIYFLILVTPILGFYDGFFGPGTGSFITMSYVYLLGFGLSRATAHAKILNFTSNISSLGYFIIFANINWTIGISMIIGQFIGSIIGAKMVISSGVKLIKPTIVAVCLIMTIVVIIKQYVKF